MRFGILGPLLVRYGDVAFDVPAARQRVLLAVLLVHAGQAVPADSLAEMVWDGSPPGGAAATLRTHVMRLRRALGPEAGARVVTRYPGYLLDAGDDEVDLLQFKRLCRDGGAAVRTGDWAQASAVLGEALGLWRGAPLADIPSQILRRDEVPGLEQARLQALEWRIDAELHLGCRGELVVALHSLAAEHPLRERFHAQLMLALYRCGRQAEALAAYQCARRVLVDELGTEPGTELRELHQRILAADPALAVPQPAPPAAGRPEPLVPRQLTSRTPRRAAIAPQAQDATTPRPPGDQPGTVTAESATPRQLPGGVADFVGRAAELAALTGMLDQVAGVGKAVVISLIGGTAGVGKTALAVRWGHQVADRFPDGQLFVDLPGYDPGQPMLAADALEGLLRALGVAADDVPAGADARAAVYRSLLAGRRVLVVLDNVGDVEQARLLLPGAPACMTVVTSRDSLAGLVARDGARRLDLDLLSLGDAALLLGPLIGGRVDAEPAAAAALAAACSRLPLALRVAAELAAAQPSASLADLVSELADHHRRLDLLDAGGDPRAAVRAVFSWSYRHLGDDAARAFRLLGLHSAADLDPYAAAALTGTPLARAGRLLGQLARAHLIQPTGPGRYGMHDLLRAYARELAAAHDGERLGRAALTRLLDYYLDAAAAAVNTLFPGQQHRRPGIPAVSATPALTDPAAARAWLDTERAGLAAAARRAAGNGWPGHATRLAAILRDYLDTGCHYTAAMTIHTCACQAARQAGDRAAEATALTNLAGVHLRQGGHQEAAGLLQQALAHCRETGHRAGEVHALNSLGFARLRQGRFQQAIAVSREALSICRETHDPGGEAFALSNLGDAALRQGRYDEAARDLRHALALFRDLGAGAAEAWCLATLGDLYVRQDRHQQAGSYRRRAMILFREAGHPSRAAEALNGFGEALLATGRPDQARVQHAAALDLACQTGDQAQQARAHDGLASIHHATGDPDQAIYHRQEASTLNDNLGVPEADLDMGDDHSE